MRHGLFISRMCLMTLLSWFIHNPVNAQLTLDDCLVKAKANYPLIKQYDLIEKSKDYTISNAGKGWLPVASLTAIEGYLISGFPSFVPGAPSSQGQFNFIGIAQINQNLWDGGAMRVEKKIAEADALASKQELDVLMYAIQDRVNQLYFGILLIDERMKQLAILKTTLDRNLASVKSSAENGLVYNSDVDEVKVELLKLEQQKTELTFSRKGYLEMLGLMTGIPVQPGQTLTAPVVIVPESLNDINRPELTLYDAQQSLIKTKEESIKVGYMPKIGLLGFGVWIEPGMSLGPKPVTSLSLAGVSLSWNTAGLYRAKNNRSLSQINLDRIQHQRETFLLNTRLQMQQSLAELEKQKALIAQDQEIVGLREGIRKAFEVKYQNGVCSMTDLIRVTNNESEARSTQALHEIQRLMSVFNFKFISGN